MAVTDGQLITGMLQPDPRVRSAALELITSSYSSDPRILSTVFEAWDRWGAELAFPEFPLISHLPIMEGMAAECIERAEAMSAGRKLTDRTCRCAGKLVEALSVCNASVFVSHLDAIEQLKHSSKVFFRVPIVSMRERASALARTSSSLHFDFEDGQPTDLVVALECLHERGEATKWIERGFREWSDDASQSPIAVAVLELASRRALSGYEEPLLQLLGSDRANVADLASIALVRCRSPKTQQRIAELFANMTRSAQLRSIDIVRRSRLQQSSDLLHYLLPLGRDFVVQDAIRIAEILLFDFESLEDWLEALLLADDKSLQRIAYALPLAHLLASESARDDWPRIRHLIQSRLGAGFELPQPTQG